MRLPCCAPGPNVAPPRLRLCCAPGNYRDNFRRVAMPMEGLSLTSPQRSHWRSAGAGTGAPGVERAYGAWTLAAVAAITALRLLWLGVQSAGLYPDEAQYWFWA